MHSLLLILTHGAAAGAGALVAYFVVMATHDETPSHPNRNDMKKAVALPAVILVASILVITIGVQSYLFQREEAKRRDEFRARVDCFNRSLSATLTYRSDLNAELADARDAKDAAEDKVLLAAAGITSTPPRGSRDDLAEALQEYVGASANLHRVKSQVAATLARTPYPKPTGQECQ